MFIDSDDWLEGTDTLEIMDKCLKDTKSDYVEIGHQRVMDRHGWIKKKGWGTIYGIIEQPQLFEDYYISYFGYNRLNVNIWGKLYRRSVIENANPKPLGVSMGEDLAFNIQVFPYLNRICIINKIGYSYRFGGMTSRYNARLLGDIKKEFLLKESLIEKYQYEKARRFACIEMKNVLKSDICQQIIFKEGNDRDIISRISVELCDQLWARVTEKENWANDSDPFVSAMMRKDAASLYDICKREVEQGKVNRMIKKVASYLCQSL